MPCLQKFEDLQRTFCLNNVHLHDAGSLQRTFTYFLLTAILSARHNAPHLTDEKKRLELSEEAQGCTASKAEILNLS